MIQIPRLFEIYKKTGELDNFGEMISNIFEPLFEVTLDPSTHPDLAEFLKHVGAIDCVDDESKSAGTRGFSSRNKTPREW